MRKGSTYFNHTYIIISGKLCYNNTYIHFFLVNCFITVTVGSVTFIDAICHAAGIALDRQTVAITLPATSRAHFIVEIHTIEFHTDWNLRSFSQDRCCHTVNPTVSQKKASRKKNLEGSRRIDHLLFAATVCVAQRVAIVCGTAGSYCVWHSG